MPNYIYWVKVSAEDRQKADVVVAGRYDLDEDLGFPYLLDFGDITEHLAEVRSLGKQIWADIAPRLTTDEVAVLVGLFGALGLKDAAEMLDAYKEE